jgi:hypothetical protein
MSLPDGTLLDAVLARYFAAYRDTIMAEDRMDEIVKAVEQSLSKGRPWEIRTSMMG